MAAEAAGDEWDEWELNIIVWELPQDIWVVPWMPARWHGVIETRKKRR